MEQHHLHQGAQHSVCNDWQMYMHVQRFTCALPRERTIATVNNTQYTASARASGRRVRVLALMGVSMFTIAYTTTQMR